MSIQNCPKAYVLGHPISHSKSPDLHAAAYSVLGESIRYGRCDTTEETLATTFLELTRGNKICGFSVTMPLKSAIIGHLDELTDFAKAVGVVNTVYWREGRAWGHNTDVSGIVNALNYAGAQYSPETVPAILGGGGTATAAVAALAYMGAKEIDVFVRDSSRAQRVLETAQRLGIYLNLKPLESYANHFHSYAVSVSTLPARAADSFAMDMKSPIRNSVLLDVSYDPWPSTIAEVFTAAGGIAVSGLEMLMYQAVDQVKLFTGRELGDALPREAEVIAAMCDAVGLTGRNLKAVRVWESSKLLRQQ